MSERDELEIEALVTDRYLESLLAARDRRDPRARRPDAEPSDTGVDRGVAATARSLEHGLTRVHPSFRFEERLAADLQAAAARLRRDGRATRSAAIRRLEPRAPAARPGPATPARPSAGNAVPRPLLIGGAALTSAALSLAGAYVAWRRGRPPVDPMVRAVRAAHRQGLARRLASRPRLAPGARGR